MSNIHLLCVETGKYIPFKHLTFSGGEEHVTVDESKVTGEVTIEANLWSSKDVMILLMLTDALRRCFVSKIDLVLKYVPYARQDRVANGGESLSIKVMCDLINAQKYEAVEIWDPHSDVTTALLERVAVVPQHELARETFLESTAPFIAASHTVFVSPDAGALKKAYQLSALYHAQVAVATKHRDTKTGQITDTMVDSKHIEDRDFLIVDDICDGGRTFIELAKVLRPLTNGRIMLYVTHGIFSKGFAPFVGLIDVIFCANLHPSHVNVDTTSPIKLVFHPAVQLSK